MTLVKTFNNTWKPEDAIDPISTIGQYQVRLFGKQKDVKQLTYLGLDTEMLVESSKQTTVWPWDLQLPQERQPKNPKFGLARHFDFHGDGFATELCVEPNYCLDLLLRSLGYAMLWLDKHNITYFKAPAIYDIPDEVEKSAPEEAKKLGCMPSLNVYGDDGQPNSLGAIKRTTGCHLHISHDNLENTDLAITLVKWADILVGCTWTYISPNPSKVESERRKSYGRAGEFRLKKYPPTGDKSASSYGVEYRVLPGTPMAHPAYLTLMFSLYREALNKACTYGEPPAELVSQAREAINTADKVEAKKVIRTLPISISGRKLIRFMRRAKLSVTNPRVWGENFAFYQSGHRTLYYNQNIESRRLTL